MGWLSQLLFGNPEQSGQVLPKQVEQWQNGETQPVQSVSPSESSVMATQGVSGQKIIPEVEIERVEPHLSGDMKHLDLWGHIKNHSSVEIELTRVQCLRQKSDPNRFLKPRESHEVKLYSGDTPRNDAERKAMLEYKIVANGDYFEAEHAIRYDYDEHDGDKFYVPDEFDLVRPIHDRY